jgi:hypothetical protein
MAEPDQEEMPPPAIRLGPPQPYLKTHGGKVARLHRFDWAVLLLLVAADVGLNLIEPFHRFVGEDMLTDLRYPLKSNTVPVWAVPVYIYNLPCDFERTELLVTGLVKDCCFGIKSRRCTR